MDYARLEFGGEGRVGFNTLPCNERAAALCMFTPAQWKRIIPGLAECRYGGGGELKVQRHIRAI